MFNKKTWFYLAILLITAIIFRLPGITRDFWRDDLFSMETLKVNIFQNPFFYGIDIHMPLYYFYLRFWNEIFKVFGVSDIEFLYRSITALLSFISIAIAYLCFSKFKGQLFGFIFGLLLAIVPLQIYYSQEVRPYYLLSTLLLIQLYFFWKIYNKEKVSLPKIKNPLIWYGLIGILALLTHLSAIFVISSYTIISLIFYKRIGYKNIINKLLGTNLLLGTLAFLLILITKLNPVLKTIDDPFETYVWYNEPFGISYFILMFNRFKEVLTLYFWHGYSYQIVSHEVQFIFKKVMLLLFILAAIYPFLKNRLKGMRFDQLIVIIFLLTLIQVYIIEKLGYFPFGGRYIMPFAVFLMYLVSNPLTWLGRRKYGIVILVCFLVTLSGLFFFHEWCYYSLLDINFHVAPNGQIAYKTCLNVR